MQMKEKYRRQDLSLEETLAMMREHNLRPMTGKRVNVERKLQEIDFFVKSYWESNVEVRGSVLGDRDE